MLPNFFCLKMYIFIFIWFKKKINLLKKNKTSFIMTVIQYLSSDGKLVSIVLIRIKSCETTGDVLLLNYSFVIYDKQFHILVKHNH